MAQLITTEQVPTWAIGYLEYGDSTGLTDEEIEAIDEWLNEYFPRGFVCVYHHDASFTFHPLWGLPCDAETVDFYEP